MTSPKRRKRSSLESVAAPLLRWFSRRTIITLVQQRVVAGRIWLEQHGTRNRTYLTAYQAPPEDAPAADAPSAPASDVEAPVYQQWRAVADAALAAGDMARAAMYAYQVAMELARLSNSDAPPVFDDLNGDPMFTNNVQSGSPSTDNTDSGIPDGIPSRLSAARMATTAKHRHSGMRTPRRRSRTPRRPGCCAALAC